MAKTGETTGSVQRSVGLRVRELRRVRELTQEQFSERLGMAAPNFARIEQGRQNITIDTLVKIARGLGVRVAELFQPPSTLATVRPGRPKGTTKKEMTSSPRSTKSRGGRPRAHSS